MIDFLYLCTGVGVSIHYLEGGGWEWLEIGILEEWRHKNYLLAVLVKCLELLQGVGRGYTEAPEFL